MMTSRSKPRGPYKRQCRNCGRDITGRAWREAVCWGCVIESGVGIDSATLARNSLTAKRILQDVDQTVRETLLSRRAMAR